MRVLNYYRKVYITFQWNDTSKSSSQSQQSRPQTPPPKQGKGLVHIECFLGRTGCSISCIILAWQPHQWFSRAALVGDSAVSHDNHMQAT